MSFVLAAAAVTGGVGAYKAISGSKQIRDGKRMAAANKRQTYNRPGEVVQALNVTERNYLNGMPGSELYQNDIDANAATAMSSATQGASSGADVLDAATKINNNSNNAYNNLARLENDFKSQALGAYTNQLGRSAEYTDKEFSYNKDQPYQQTAAAASALIGAGNQNVFSGVNDIAGAATSVMGSMTPQAKTFVPEQQSIDKLGFTNIAMPAGPLNPAMSGKLVFGPDGKPRLVQ